MKKVIKILVVFLAAVMVFALPMEASAATRKVKAEQLTGSTVYKKVPAVKVGKNIITCKTSRAYDESVIKFTATKTKTYSLTFSNLRIGGKTSAKSKISGGFLFSDSATTKDGTTTRMVKKCKIQAKYKEGLGFYCAYLCSKGFKTVYKTGTTSCTVKVTMKKGQTLYINEYSNQTNKRAYDLTIK